MDEQPTPPEDQLTDAEMEMMAAGKADADESKDGSTAFSLACRTVAQCP